MSIIIITIHLQWCMAHLHSVLLWPEWTASIGLVAGQRAVFRQTWMQCSIRSTIADLQLSIYHAQLQVLQPPTLFPEIWVDLRKKRQAKLGWIFWALTDHQYDSRLIVSFFLSCLLYILCFGCDTMTGSSSPRLFQLRASWLSIVELYMELLLWWNSVKTVFYTCFLAGKHIRSLVSSIYIESCSSVRLPVHQSVFLSFRLSVCLSACPSVSPSACPCVCLSVLPSVCLSLRVYTLSLDYKLSIF